jgi:hypothetical protein
MNGQVEAIKIGKMPEFRNLTLQFANFGMNQRLTEPAQKREKNVHPVKPALVQIGRFPLNHNHLTGFENQFQ